jgi:hypothetical protein
MMPGPMGTLRAVLPVFLAASCLCACRAVETSYRYPDDLDHPDYVKRAKAVDEFVSRGDAARLPHAFHLLRDPDPGIRAQAWLAIRDLSGGEDFGYRPYLSAGVRAGIVARWRAWWCSGRGAPEPEREAVGG